MNTITIDRLSNGAVSVTVNGGEPRTLINPTNILVKPLSDGSGVIVKKSDETWRQHVLLEDSVTIDGTAAPTVLADLIEVLSNNVFGGEIDFVTPAKLAQTITFAAPAGRAHTAPAFLAGATASSGLAVTYVSSDPTKATVNATTGLITPVAAGATDITASQAGNLFYSAAVDVVHTLTLS